MVKPTQALTTRQVPEERVSSVVARGLGAHLVTINLYSKSC